MPQAQPDAMGDGFPFSTIFMAALPRAGAVWRGAGGKGRVGDGG
jgi:hypothetical protein